MELRATSSNCPDHNEQCRGRHVTHSQRFIPPNSHLCTKMSHDDEHAEPPRGCFTAEAAPLLQTEDGCDFASVSTEQSDGRKEGREITPTTPAGRSRGDIKHRFISRNQRRENGERLREDNDIFRVKDRKCLFHRTKTASGAR